MIKICINSNATRVGLLAGAVKLSVDQGVWSTGTEKTSVLFEQVKSKVLPGTIVYPEKVTFLVIVSVIVIYNFNV